MRVWHEADWFWFSFLSLLAWDHPLKLSYLFMNKSNQNNFFKKKYSFVLNIFLIALALFKLYSLEKDKTLLGVSWEVGDRLKFSLWSLHATSVQLCTLLAAKISLLSFNCGVLLKKTKTKQNSTTEEQFLTSLFQSHNCTPAQMAEAADLVLWLRLKASHMLKCDSERFALKPNHSQGAVIAVFDCTDFTCGLGFAWACLGWPNFSCSPPVKP